eukprot:15296792-Alexandrium_andersonii.AAC.1
MPQPGTRVVFTEQPQPSKAGRERSSRGPEIRSSTSREMTVPGSPRISSPWSHPWIRTGRAASLRLTEVSSATIRAPRQ